LMAACGIAPEDDDGQAASKTVVKAPVKQAIDELRLNAAIEKILDGSYTVGKLKANFALTAEQVKLVNEVCGE